MTARELRRALAALVGGLGVIVAVLALAVILGG
jgi:hypothetical protein